MTITILRLVVSSLLVINFPPSTTDWRLTDLRRWWIGMRIIFLLNQELGWEHFGTQPGIRLRILLCSRRNWDEYFCAQLGMRMRILLCSMRIEAEYFCAPWGMRILLCSVGIDLKHLCDNMRSVKRLPSKTNKRALNTKGLCIILWLGFNPFSRWGWGQPAAKLGQSQLADELDISHFF